MHKPSFSFDERELKVFRTICTVMYLITLVALMGIQLYRQFVLHQPQQAWDDIAMLITVNVLVLFGAVLYLTGAVNPKKIKPGYLIAGYVGFVLLGFAFTVFKYTILLGQRVNLAQILNYLLTIIVISGILALTWGLLAYLGSRKIDEQIE